MAYQRKTRDLCQTDWQDANPGEYFPDGIRYGTCAKCGEDTLVSRSWIANEAQDEPCDECSGTRWPVSKHESSCSLYGVNEGVTA